ncbi:hypothetical protein [Arenimonas composti]|nr:hypothetical protein [Arenimonas composti]
MNADDLHGASGANDALAEAGFALRRDPKRRRVATGYAPTKKMNLRA